jgi:lipopolysaccharide export LptBFGC system permease protein LptF
VRLSELALDEFASTDRAGLDQQALLAGVAERLGAPDEAVPEAVLARLAWARDELVRRTSYYADEVVARITQRASQSMTAVLMLLAGSILAILLRSKPALFVYLVTFLPAILCILLISGGEQMLRREVGVPGFAVSLAGNGVLLAVCLWGAWKVGRH